MIEIVAVKFFIALVVTFGLMLHGLILMLHSIGIIKSEFLTKHFAGRFGDKEFFVGGIQFLIFFYIAAGIF